MAWTSLRLKPVFAGGYWYITCTSLSETSGLTVSRAERW